jgi:iron complex transport system ATP-binding protein
MTRPDLLLLDEPAAGLDLGARETLVARIATLAAEPSPAAVVLVTHHLEEIQPGFTHAGVTAGGRIVAAANIGSALTSASLSEALGLPVRLRRIAGRYTASAATPAVRRCRRRSP